MKQAGVCAAAVVVVIAVSACGGGPSAQGQVAAALKSYLSAIADGNGTAACSDVTDAEAQEIVQQGSSLGATTCEQTVSQAAGQLGGDGQAKLRNAQVVDVNVNGNTATAGLQGGTQTADLTKVDGRWLISGGIQ